MLLIISLSTFIVLATVALFGWAGLVLWFTGRTKTKKAARPAPTLMSFFQPAAGKTSINVPMPMATYHRSELTPLNLEIPLKPFIPTNNAAPETSEESADEETQLDDPAFAPSASPLINVEQPASIHTTPPDGNSFPSPFRVSFDRQLLSRLLGDDVLCEQFGEVRAITLERQRETGRSYASLFREAVADKPADVQDILLNLLTEEETDDFDRSFPGYM